MGKMDKDQFAEFAGRVISQLPRNLDVEVAQRWIDDSAALRTTLTLALREGPPKDVDPNAWIDTFDLSQIKKRVFEVTIDPTQTIEQMIVAGEYNYVDPNHTTAIFGHCRKITGDKPVKIKVVAFRIGRNATREQAIRLRARLNLGPICIQHELALGAQHKNAQRDLNWIVNVDDEVLAAGVCCVSCLFGLADARDLGLSGAGAEWCARAWFLGLARESE